MSPRDGASSGRCASQTLLSLPWNCKLVLSDGPSRVIDVGVARRLFDGANRRAVQVRDQECVHDLCNEPAEGCGIDHVEPWSAGGATVAANGRVACGHHNRRRHRRP